MERRTILKVQADALAEEHNAQIDEEWLALKAVFTSFSTASRQRAPMPPHAALPLPTTPAPPILVGRRAGRHAQGQGARVDFEEAHERGREGERLVSSELTRLRRRHPIWFADNVLLEVGGKTTQIDHVVVDAYGVIVVETKCRKGALLRGTSADESWTACYPGMLREPVLNPIAQNAWHVGMLQHALRGHGIDLPDDTFANVVVFTHGDIAHLKLEDDPAIAVLTVHELVDLLVRRQRPPDGPRPLASGLALEVAKAIQELDCSGNPEARARHDARMTCRRDAEPARTLSAEMTPQFASRRGDATTFDRTRRHSSISGLAAAGAGLALVLAMLLGGGMPWAAKALRTLTSLATPARDPAPSAVPSSGPNIEQAKRVLRESDPETFAKITNLDSPQVGTKNGVPTYTWRYTDKLSADKVRVRSLTMAIDAAGTLRGITRE